MTIFADLSSLLWRSPTDGAAAQRRVDELFPSVAAAQAFRNWAPGDPVDDHGQRLLIGVATWSAPDMQFLDSLAASPPPITIDVFTVAECRSMADFERYVPGIGTVFHTPVVGLWRDGQLVSTASGFPARDLVSRVLEGRS